MKAKVIQKLGKVRKRRYIAPGYVTSLTSFFAVPKGDDDIRMVYDGTVSGLNDAMWVPRFGMSTLETHFRSLEPGTHMADVDVGECFLNFVLHKSVRPLTGVDLTHYFPGDLNDSVVWETWLRAAMGLKSSPYQAGQGCCVADEVIRGDPGDQHNVFRWDTVRMNCPGSEGYDASKPWVSKVRKEDGCIASDFVSFVDDFRPSGPTSKEAWQAARRVAAGLNYLGLQDAPRKRRNSSVNPGAWIGGVVRTSNGRVVVTISEKKWKKTLNMIDEVINMIATDPDKLNRKRLEQIRGYLGYVTRTFPCSVPYMIGLHLTIDGWRKNRDKEGWRIQPKGCAKKPTQHYHFDLGDDGRVAKPWESAKEWMVEEETDLGCTREQQQEIEEGNTPIVVRAAPRLRSDMQALKHLFSGETPPVRDIRCKSSTNFFYGFGDASGTSFGSSFEKDQHIEFEYGQWCTESSERSSNWRELKNVVEAVRSFVEKHDLLGAEIFIFTDNSTAEGAFWKGTSSSRRLFELVLELRELQMRRGLHLHVVHVSGRRMIQQGSDGLSRGDHTQGSMAAIPIRSFIPLHLSAFDRSPDLKKWTKNATHGLDFEFLDPSRWFEHHHGYGNYVWAPPPAACDVVVEQLAKARWKRPESMHVVIVPRLMTGRWRRHLTRGTDAHLELAVSPWNLAEQCEPLLIFIALPFRSDDPKFEERQRVLENHERSVRKVQEMDGRVGRAILRKLLLAARSLCSL